MRQTTLTVSGSPGVPKLIPDADKPNCCAQSLNVRHPGVGEDDVHVHSCAFEVFSVQHRLQETQPIPDPPHLVEPVEELLDGPHLVGRLEPRNHGDEVQPFGKTIVRF